MDVNKEWNYKESLLFIDAVKRKYEGIMLSFSVINKNILLREIKEDIYSLKFEEWKRDKLWEYLNNDIDYINLWQFAWLLDNFIKSCYNCWEVIYMPIKKVRRNKNEYK